MLVFTHAVLLNTVIALAYVAALVLVADRYEREPTRMLLRVYLVGIAATMALTWLKCDVLGLCGDTGLSPWVEQFVVAGLGEETVKFGVFVWFARRSRDLDEPLDAMVYLGMAALAFAFHENVGYFMAYAGDAAKLSQISGDGSLYRAAVGDVTVARAMPGHLLFDTIAAWWLALGLRRGHMWRYLAPALVTAVVLHAAWNLIPWGVPFLMYVALLLVASIVAVGWAHRRSPHRQRQEKFLVSLQALPWPDATVPRRLVAGLRTLDGPRQAQIMAEAEMAMSEGAQDDAVTTVELLLSAAARPLGRVARALALLGAVVGLSILAEFTLLAWLAMLAGM